MGLQRRAQPALNPRFKYPAPAPNLRRTRMAERAALITGGSSGIGLAIARALGQDGYGLTVSARRPEKLEEAVQGLRDEGLDVNAVPANMTDEAAIKQVIDSHRERFGRLDVLINNAGVGIAAPIEQAETKK